jgi:PleD family two-component response regulator
VLLQQLASVLLAETRREVDVAARLGGAEFVVVMPNTPDREGDAAALRVAERIRAAVSGQAFEGHPGRPDEHATVSIGLAGITDVADLGPFVAARAARDDDDAHASARTAAALLSAADKALYRAKSEGRDRVCRYGMHPSRREEPSRLSDADSRAS